MSNTPTDVVLRSKFTGHFVLTALATRVLFTADQASARRYQSVRAIEAHFGKQWHEGYEAVGVA